MALLIVSGVTLITHAFVHPDSTDGVLVGIGMTTLTIFFGWLVLDLIIGIFKEIRKR